MALIALILFTLFARSWWCKIHRSHEKKTPEVSSPIGQGEKLQFPSVIPAPWNAGIVLVTARFQSTLKCNWTLERQTEKGRHCQGQSLAWHAIATSGLIDLYKANPPSILSHWFRLLSVEKLYDRTGCSSASSILFSNFHNCPRSKSPVKNQSGKWPVFWIGDLSV